MAKPILFIRAGFISERQLKDLRDYLVDYFVITSLEKDLSSPILEIINEENNKTS